MDSSRMLIVTYVMENVQKLISWEKIVDINMETFLKKQAQT